MKVSGFLLVFVGFLGDQGQAHDGWGQRPQNNRMCPYEDSETHECYELTTENSTCIFMKIDGCDPDYTSFCKLEVTYERRPCTVYVCSHQGCCEGYTHDEYGQCASGASVQSIRCENGATKTDDGKCECAERFDGRRCENPICDDSCLNGGRCEVDLGVPRCMCPSSLYSGERCETVSCVDSCLNEGECIQDGVLSRCICTHGYQGDRCQFSINTNCPVVTRRSRSECGVIWNECESDMNCKNNTDTTVCCHNGCYGECREPIPKKCRYNGDIYDSGETFSPDSCKKCACQMYGTVKCTEIICPEKSCPGGHSPLRIEGHCCKVCPGMNLIDTEVPRFTNCPEHFVVLNVSAAGDEAEMPEMNLEVEDVIGSKLAVSFSQDKFYHSHSSEMYKNVHIVTAYSECDPHGKRAECHFKVIVRDTFPPIFTSCPASIYASEDEVITWQEPVISDNVGVYSIKVDGDIVRNRAPSVGTYPVSYTVSDFDQNQAICAFLVRVLDESIEDRFKNPLYDQTHDFPTTTIVGITMGMLVASGLCLCFIVRVRQLRREQEQDDQPTQQDNIVYSVYEPDGQSNLVVYENTIKLPSLPDYSPISNPPSYDQIDHCDELGLAEKIEPPIYEEITNAVARDSHQYENLGNGEVNNAYVNEETKMEYMKI